MISTWNPYVTFDTIFALYFYGITYMLQPNVTVSHKNNMNTFIRFLDEVVVFVFLTENVNLSFG